MSRRILGCIAAAFCAAWLIKDTPTPLNIDAPRAAAEPHATPVRFTPPTSTPASLPFIRHADGTLSPRMPPPPDPNSRWKNPAKRVEPFFPPSFEQPVRITCGSANVSARPLNAKASAPEIADDGALVYRNAFEGCDVEYRCGEFKTEEFIVVRELPSDRSSLEFQWAIDTHGLKPRLTPAHSIELCDEQKVPRLRINPPDGKDAAGKRLEAGKQLTFALTESGVTLRADVSACELPIVIDPTWSSTGTMTVARHLHSAVKLQTGSLLVIGGNNESGSNLTSEVFDPSSKTWGDVATMSVARVGHTTTLLNNGKVLVTGGIGPGTRPCEVYTPGSGWMQTASLQQAKHYHAAHIMADGKVLIAGGYDGAITNLKTCETYDPASDALSSATDLNHGRIYSYLLPWDNNTLLMIGSGTTAERYDPVLNAWSDEGFGCSTIHALVKLASGVTLSAESSFNTMLYDPVTRLPITGNERNEERETPSAALLSNGMVLISGGYRFQGGTAVWSRTAEVYNSSSGMWKYTSSMSELRGNHCMTLLNDGTMLVTGGRYFSSGNYTNHATCELFDVMPRALQASTTTHSNTSVAVSLTAEAIGNNLSFNVVANPSHGSLTISGGTFSYLPNPNFVGTDTFSFSATDTLGTGGPAIITITVTNLPPIATVSASPSSIPAGGSTQLSAIASDPDGDPLSFSWNFGDGSPVSTEQNPVHVYTSPGDYAATVTVTDSIGASTTATVMIHVGRAPVVRFTTSDVVGFVGLPLTFDATTSTDPENGIASYAWNFGDGSPLGSGQQISRIYTAEGTYTITLTITDKEGLSSSLSRQILILPAAQLGLFNGFISYSVKWDRSKDNADSLTLNASLNVGDLVVSPGPQVAVEIAGKRYEATLDAKLRAKDLNASWQVIANTKKQKPGELLLRLKVKKTSLGAEFNQAGALPGADDEASVGIPVHVEISGRVFELLIDSDFTFTKNGQKASGVGEGP